MLKQSRYISVFLSSSLVKAAQVTQAGVVEKLAMKAVAAGAADAALKDALAGFQLKGSGVVCVLPGDVATTKRLEVPSVDREEIESIIALQATRHTPFNKDEILTSYIKLGTPRPNFSSVLLIVVKRDVVKEKLDVMRAAGLSIAAVLFVPESLSYFYARAVNPKKGERTAILDAGSQNTSFIVMNDGVPVMARNIPVGIEGIAADPAALTQVVDEVKASVEAFEQENGAKPARIILTSAHRALSGIDKALLEAVAIRVETVPYATIVKATPGVKAQLAKDFADEPVLDVIATAATAVKCAADLVPQEIKDQRSVIEKGREVMKAGIFILLILVFLGAGLLSRVYFKDLFLKKNLVEKYADQKQEVGMLEGMINKTRVLREYLQARQVPLEAIRELYSVIPDEMYLSSVSMDEAGNVAIQGISESMSRVFALVTALEESPLFENVKTKSTTAKKERGKDMAAFEIVFRISGSSPAPAEAVEGAAAQQGKQGAGLDQ